MTDMTPYQVSVLPSGSIDARQATGADFGTGPAMENLGSSMLNAVDTYNRVQADQANLWASTAAAKQEVNIRTQWSKQVNSLDPSSPDYADQISKMTSNANDLWSQSVDDAVAQAPNGRAAAFLKEHMGRAQVAFTGQVLQQQSTLNGQYTSDLFTQDTNTRAQSVAAAGGSDDAYKTNLAAMQATVGALTSVNPVTKERLLQDGQHTLALAQVQTVAQQNPGLLLQSIEPSGGVQTPSPSQEFTAAMAPDGTATQALKDAVVHVESHGDPSAVSKKGAIGLGQIMPATATSLGFTPQDMFDAAKNAQASGMYLNQMLSQFKDPQLALAAYNAGPGEVAGLIKQYGNSFDAIEAHLPAETQAYVPKVLGQLGGASAATPSLPQVQPLTEKQVMGANPPIAGWNALSWPEKMQAVRMAEAKQGQGLATGRAALTAALSDANALHMQGQPSPEDNGNRLTEANLTAYFGPVQGPRMYQEYSQTKALGSTIAQMATTPTAQIAQQLAADKPTGDDAGQMVPKWNQAVTAFQHVQKAQQSQWMDYAYHNNIQGFQPLDPSKPQEFIAGLAGRQQVMQMGVNDYGIKKPVVFTSTEAQAIGNQLDQMKPTDRINFLVNMERGLTDPTARQVALNQIAPGREGLAVALSIAMNPGYVHFADGKTQAASEVGQMVATGDYILNGGMKKAGTPGTTDAPQPNGKGALGLNTKAFRQEFDQAVGGPSAFQGDNATYGAKVQRQMMNAALDYYVADAHKRGLDVTQPNTADVKRAVDAVTGGVVKINGSSLFAPFGTDPATFHNQFNARATQALVAAGYDAGHAAASLGPGGHLVPINVRDNQYGFMNGTHRLLNAAGTAPVVVDYSQPAPAQQPSSFKQFLEKTW